MEKRDIFREIVIDLGSELKHEPSEHNLHLYSSLYLLADSVLSGFVVVGHTIHDLSIYASRPTMPHHYSDDMNMGLTGHSIIFSSNPEVRKATLINFGLSAQSAILLLAAAGLNFSLPSAIFRNLQSDEFWNIKEKLATERNEYLQAISKIADQSFDRLSSGVYRDTIDWALNEAVFKLKPAADALDKSLKKLDKPLLKRIGVDFFKDGLPSICKAFVNEGAKEAGKTSMEEVLKILCSGLMQNLEGRRIPEANYGIRFLRMARHRKLVSNEAI